MDAVRTSVRLHGHTVAYVDLPGGGTPLLLVHGVGSSIDTWGGLPRRLSDAGHRVIALDLLGHGESGPGNGDYSLGANASVIRDLLDHLGVGRIHLVGHSLGGGVSMQFTYQFGERVESLTLVSSGGLGREVSGGLRAATLPGSEAVMRALTHDAVVDTLDRIGTLQVALGTPRQGVTAVRTIDKLRRLHDPRRLEGFLATVRSVVGPEGQRVSALEKLDAMDSSRVLIIWGEADRMLPSHHGTQARELLPGSRLVTVPGAGHHPHTDDPDTVLAELLAHVRRVEDSLRTAAA